jgi:hypothetical protein
MSDTTSEPVPFDTTGLSRSTLTRWRKAGAPLHDSKAMDAWLVMRKSLPDAILRRLGRQAATPTRPSEPLHVLEQRTDIYGAHLDTLSPDSPAFEIIFKAWSLAFSDWLKHPETVEALKKSIASS